MSVRERELVAIFGPSGSGKTTLLLLPGGLLRRPTPAACASRDATLATLPSASPRLPARELGFVFQDFNLMAGPHRRGERRDAAAARGVGTTPARERALAALAEVGLAERAEHGPDRLSGGEQQRVAIARALVGRPKLVLADEPTGNLDTETGECVLELLSELPREHGAAAILVTHDARVARYADRVLAMRDGKLTEPDLETQAALEE